MAGMAAQPLVWVIIPLLAIFAAGCFTLFVWRRHARARHGGGGDDGWPEDRILMPSGFYMARTGRRWRAPDRGRSLEGLDELGEAPPPYEAKKPPSMDHDAAGYSVASPPGAHVATCSPRA